MSIILGTKRECDGCNRVRECVKANLLGVRVYLCSECEEQQGPMEPVFVMREPKRSRL